jgi:hypothetical protein
MSNVALVENVVLRIAHYTSIHPFPSTLYMQLMHFHIPISICLSKGGEKFRRIAVDVAICGGMAQPSQLALAEVTCDRLTQTIRECRTPLSHCLL